MENKKERKKETAEEQMKRKLKLRKHRKKTVDRLNIIHGYADIPVTCASYAMFKQIVQFPSRLGFHSPLWYNSSAKSIKFYASQNFGPE